MENREWDNAGTYRALMIVMVNLFCSLILGSANCMYGSNGIVIGKVYRWTLIRRECFNE